MSGELQMPDFIGWTVRGNFGSSPHAGRQILEGCGKHVRRKNRKDVVEGYRKDVDWWKSWKVLDKKERLVVRREKRMCAAVRYKDLGMLGRTSQGGNFEKFRCNAVSQLVIAVKASK